jgi:3-hydroxymyristoyl/3-hydroxydecanoyl-(acyl carrier protein) dehydratase
VCPGSLGIESFLQLLKFAARERWPHLTGSHRFATQTGRSHRWTYRGQILPGNQRVTVEAAVTEVLESPHPALVAEGYLLVDGLFIYRMEEFGIQLIPG